MLHTSKQKIIRKLHSPSQRVGNPCSRILSLPTLNSSHEKIRLWPLTFSYDWPPRRTLSVGDPHITGGLCWMVLLECYITSSRMFSTEDPFRQWQSCIPSASASPRLQALYKVKHLLAGQLGQPLDISFYSTLCSFIKKTGGPLSLWGSPETASSGPPCFQVRTFRKHCQSLSSWAPHIPGDICQLSQESQISKCLLKCHPGNESYPDFMI